MIIGNHKIDDWWEIDAQSNVDSLENSKYITIYNDRSVTTAAIIIFKYKDPSLKLKYAIALGSIFLVDSYRRMFKKEYYESRFATSLAAREHVDYFLNKLHKLNVFT